MTFVARGSAASPLPCITGRGQECAVFIQCGAFWSFSPVLVPFWQPSSNAGTLAPWHQGACVVGWIVITGRGTFLHKNNPGRLFPLRRQHTSKEEKHKDKKKFYSVGLSGGGVFVWRIPRLTSFSNLEMHQTSWELRGNIHCDAHRMLPLRRVMQRSDLRCIALLQIC